MKYEFAPDLHLIAKEISYFIFPYINMDRVSCLRSYGTSSRGTIARCHGLSKVMQKALGIKAVYVLEFLSERFDKMSEEDKLKVIIHELMHIPKTFGGGFIHHNMVNDKTVNRCYLEYKRRKNEQRDLDFL